MTTLVLLDVMRGAWPRALRLGASAGEVLAALGPTATYATRSRRDGRVAILKYGDIELHFGDAGLWLLHAEAFEDVPRGSGGLAVEAGWLRRGVPLAEARAQLGAQAAPWVEREGRDPRCAQLHVPPLGTLVFRIGGDDEQTGLTTISVHEGPRLER